MTTENMTHQPTLDDLIKTLKNEIDGLDLAELTATTNFRQIDGWNSLHSLIIMAIVSTEYDIELGADVIQAIRTVTDLHRAIIEHST